MGPELAGASRAGLASVTIHLLVERQVARTPDATAIAFRKIRLTFAEVDLRANRLAHMLRAHGVGRGTVVALYMERSADAVVALLGVLKAGGAYLLRRNSRRALYRYL